MQSCKWDEMSLKVGSEKEGKVRKDQGRVLQQ